MVEFLLKVWDLARPYRGRLLLGVLTGIIAGFMEPLMIATITFVYSLIFPSGDGLVALLSPKTLSNAPALVQKLIHPADPVSTFIANQLSTNDWAELTNRLPGSTQSLAIILAQKLNDVILSPSFYQPERFAKVKLSAETRELLVQNPHGEQLVRLNRLLLHEAYPAETVAPDSFLSRLKGAPQFVTRWATAAEQSLTSNARAHPGTVAVLVGLIPLVLFLRSLFSYLNIYLLQWTAIRVITGLRNQLFEHIMRLSAGFLSRTNTGELTSRLINDTSTLQYVITGTVPVMFKDPVILGSTFTYLVWQQPKITLISLVVLPVCVAPIFIFNRKLRQSGRAIQTHAAEMGSVAVESFAGHRIVKAYNLEPTVVKQFETASQKYVGQYMRILRSAEIPGPLLEFVGALGVALVLLYLISQGNARPTSTDFLTVILGIFTMYRPLKNLTRLYSGLEQARAASERVFELLATRDDIPETAQPKPLRAAGAPIHFDQVHFSYGEKPVLRGITLTIKPGQLVALVGSSGSGKTTLTSLLLRFYDPTKGAIRIGDTNLREVAARELRDQMAVVTQETVLFNDTILRNIELGRPGASNAEILEAARHAHAYDFIMEKPGGFDTIIGDRGVLLSGGQRQRLAIARAVLRNAPILILDEATSSLDSESERSVQSALEELLQGRTTLCIAHRLSTVQKADVIVVLDAGRIVETGTHDELLKKRGFYCRLYELQFQPNLQPNPD